MGKWKIKAVYPLFHVVLDNEIVLERDHLGNWNSVSENKQQSEGEVLMLELMFKDFMGWIRWFNFIQRNEQMKVKQKYNFYKQQMEQELCRQYNKLAMQGLIIVLSVTLIAVFLCK